MKLDVDSIIDRNVPWEFIVVIGGVELATRRPTAAEISELAGFDTIDRLRIRELLGSFFMDPAAACTNGWSLAQILCFAMGVAQHWINGQFRTSQVAGLIEETQAAVHAAATPPAARQDSPPQSIIASGSCKLN